MASVTPTAIPTEMETAREKLINTKKTCLLRKCISDYKEMKFTWNTDNVVFRFLAEFSIPLRGTSVKEDKSVR